MAKKKRKKSFSKQKHSHIVALSDPRQQGLKDFHAGRYDKAIEAWQALAKQEPKIAEALAEAYYRRSLTWATLQDQLADLRRAVEYAPEHLPYHYHMGIVLHKLGEMAEAISCYRTVLQKQPQHTNASIALALAELHENPGVDITALPGNTIAIQEKIRPVTMLLQDLPAASNEQQQTDIIQQIQRSATTLPYFWAGLGYVQTGKMTEAREAFSQEKLAHSGKASAVHSYCQGIISYQEDNLVDAINYWLRALEQGMQQPRLYDNLTVSLVQHLRNLLAQESVEALEEANTIAHRVLRKMSPRIVALDEMLVMALDRYALQQATSGNWKDAIENWEIARDIVSASSTLGSPRPLLHNLALGYEATEDWMSAAETWRAMQRTRPRATTQSKQKADKDKDQLGLREEQWSWIQKRIIHCYKMAQRPDEAVNIYRQAIKKEPENLELRLQYADALDANEQDQAAINEYHRILEVDSQYVEAHLRLAGIYSRLEMWDQAEQSLRRVLELEPERDDVRREVVRLMIQRGYSYLAFGWFAQARKIFEEGQEFAPDDFQFPLSLARVSIDEKKVDEAKDHLDRVLKLAPDRHDVYMSIFECWAVANRPKEAYEIVELAESRLEDTILDFYSEIISLLARQTAEPVADSFISLIMGKPKAPRIDPQTWVPICKNLLERAEKFVDKDPSFYATITLEVMVEQPELALMCAEKSVEMQPEEPNAYLMLGLAQGMNNQVKEAKKTLGQAARMARQQGDMLTAQHAEAMRQEVGKPHFRSVLTEGLSLDLDDFFA
jgi:tetratricopeptide (TPR) repeat protein